jgi:hypothetical protein
MTLAECYLAVMLCVGATRPPPKVVILDAPHVPCRSLAGRCVDPACSQRYDGTCSGVRRGRTIRLTWGDLEAGQLERVFAHEVVHYLVGDAKHEGPAWRCQQECG